MSGIFTPEYDQEILDNLKKIDIEKGFSVVKSILSATDDEICSRNFILEMVLKFGLSKQPWDQWARLTDSMNSSSFGLQQMPTEFSDFLLFLSKQNIVNSLEIGVLYGATAFVTAAVLQRVNPSAVYHMLDIEDHIVGFDRFASILNLRKLIPNTSADIVGQQFDYVLIDADHSYNGAKTDYLNVGRYARKVVAFHDIHGHEYDHQDGGIVRAWNEIRATNADKRTIIEFAHNPKRWMGIGAVVMTDDGGFH